VKQHHDRKENLMDNRFHFPRTDKFSGPDGRIVDIEEGVTRYTIRDSGTSIVVHKIFQPKYDQIKATIANQCLRDKDPFNRGTTRDKTEIYTVQSVGGDPHKNKWEVGPELAVNGVVETFVHPTSSLGR
jgi:hypothetical protein